VSVYLDASVLVALLTSDPFTVRADAFLRAGWPMVIVSDFAATEFASAIARRVRTRELTRRDANNALSTFDAWSAQESQRVHIGSSDIAAADAFLRRLDGNLRAPDAIHIAVAQRLGADLATFDEKMRASARAFGTTIAKL
jgi:uncharacterized protein